MSGERRQSLNIDSPINAAAMKDQPYNSLGDVTRSTGSGDSGSGDANPNRAGAVVSILPVDAAPAASSGGGIGTDESTRLTASLAARSDDNDKPTGDGGAIVPAETTRFVYLLTFFAAIGGFLFGYDTGVISGAILFIHDDFNLSDFQVELAVSGATAGAMVGALFGGPMNDRFGRRVSIMAAACTFMAGALIMAAAPAFGVLLVGRLVVGLGVGVASATVPMYVAEVAPPQHRGFLVSLNGFFITGGQFISYLMDSALADVSGGWRWMVGISALPALVQFIGMWFLPESPRFLYARGQTNEARAVLCRVLARPDSDPAVTSELRDIATEVEAEQSGSWGQLWSVPGLRRAMIVACGLQFFQQFAGINTAMYYSPIILKSAGFSSKTQAILFSDAVAFTNMIMTVVAMRLIDTTGRRKLLLRSLIGVIVGLFLLGGTFYLIAGVEKAHDTCEAYSHCSVCVGASGCGWCIPPGADFTASDGFCAAGNKTDPFTHACQDWALNAGCGGSIGGWLALFSLVFYVAFFGVGLGTIPWVIQAEVFPTPVRGKANGIATAVNWSSNLVVSMTFLTLSNRMSQAGTFWLYTAIGVAAWAFVYRFVPETKGRTLEQISASFAADTHRTGGRTGAVIDE